MVNEDKEREKEKSLITEYIIPCRYGKYIRKFTNAYAISLVGKELKREKKYSLSSHIIHFFDILSSHFALCNNTIYR